MKKPQKLSPIVYVEIEVNYRWRGGEPACAFVTVIEQRGSLHRRIVDTVHLQGTPIQLIDLVEAECRRLTLEHVLSHVEPF